jgi:hypothetical protein
VPCAVVDTGLDDARGKVPATGEFLGESWRTAGGGVARYYWPDVQQQVAELRRRRGE